MNSILEYQKKRKKQKNMIKIILTEEELTNLLSDDEQSKVEWKQNCPKCNKKISIIIRKENLNDFKK